MLLAGIISFYLFIALIGLLPVNSDFQSAANDGGVEIYLTSNAVHADVVLPVDSELINWRKELPHDAFDPSTAEFTHLAIGWGDHDFFVNTPTWSDLKASTAAKAFFLPSNTCIHVDFLNPDQIAGDQRRVRISKDQYRRLIDYVRDSFKLDNQACKCPIAGAAYGSSDAFFEARGSYHCFNTCNCWVGGAMRAAGIKTGWFTPLPKSIFFHLSGDDHSALPAIHE